MTLRKLFISLTLISTLGSFAGNIVKLKNAGAAMLNVFAYNADGKLLNSGTGFYVTGNGIAVATYDVFKGAYRAEVIDNKGKKYNVLRICGANSTTDMVKFTVDNGHNNDYFTITESPASMDETLYMVKYSTNKKEVPTSITISSDEAYNTYRYYHISAKNDAAYINCPLINAEGVLIGLTQKNVDKKATTSCAIDSRFINDLRISATSSLSGDLRKINIAKALPENAKDALTYIYMLPASDSITNSTAYNDFIAAYPEMPEGYVNRANYYAAQYKYKESESDFLQAITKCGTDTTGMSSDAVHYQFSNAIYQAALSHGNESEVYVNWNFKRAEEEATTAYQIMPHTLYLMQQGNCRYAQQNYEGAYESYHQACNDPSFASSDTYFYAARALELTGRDSLMVLTLLDSCIAKLPKLVNARYASYYLERSQRLINANRYREAVFDYNEYEKAVGPRNLNANFYYLREQAEMEAHMYQQALDDIRTAIATSSTPQLFRLEEAYILLRVGEFQMAVDAAKNLLAELPENPDCYKIIGISYGELGHKADALKNLQKAQELGDTTVTTFIEKYK